MIGIALAPADGGGDVLAADRRGDRLLHVADGQPIAGGDGAVHVDIDVEALGDAFGEDAAGVRHGAEKFLDLRADMLNLAEVRALNLQSHRSFDSGQFHVEPVLDRHRPRCWKVRES